MSMDGMHIGTFYVTDSVTKCGNTIT